jgi:hypothetical protein
LGFETKKATDLKETDGLVETAYDLILALLKHDHLLTIREENKRDFTQERKRYETGGGYKNNIVKTV